jgi:hypothetical protein
MVCSVISPRRLGDVGGSCRPLKNMLLRCFHDGSFAVHFGARKTLGKVASNFWWLVMRNEVFKYDQECELCERANPAQNMRVGLHSSEPPSQPMEKLFVDFVGTLVRTKRGNIVILVVVDVFYKFVAFYPVRRITARVVVDRLGRGNFPAYGTPKYGVTDNARMLCCKNFKRLCFRWGVELLTTTPYYPQASLAERVSRNLKAALKIFHHESQYAWDEECLWLSTTFNMAVHESTQATPDLLFWGLRDEVSFGSPLGLVLC